MVTTYKVPAVKCEGYASTIEKTLADLSGLTVTQVLVPAREARIEFDPARLRESEIDQALTAAGFPPAL